MAGSTIKNEPKDIRPDAGEYPNYYSHKTPSGHLIMMDDTNGQEHVTIQHRSGSIIQMKPDGQVHIRAQNKKWEMVFGESTTVITGDHDITVNGGGSFLVEGDYDVTVLGNHHIAIEGNQETVIKGNQNTLIKGNQDLAVDGGQTTKVTGNMEHTTEGKLHIGADTGLRIESNNGKVNIAAEDNVEIDTAADALTTAQGEIKDTAQGKHTSIGSEVHHNP